MSGRASQTTRRGAILIAVLAFLAFAGALAALAGADGRSALGWARALGDQARLRAAIDSAIAAAAINVRALNPDDLLPANGEARVWPFYDDIEIEVRALAERARLDINLSSVDTMERVFSSLGKSPNDARKLAETVADWRDQDDTPRPSGAESLDYRNAGIAEPGNRPFRDVAEFRSVLGVDAEFFARAAPYLTIYGAPSPDEALAPPAIAGAARDGIRPPPPGAGGAPGPTGASFYAIFIKVQRNGAELSQEALIQSPGPQGAPYRVLKRRRSNPERIAQLFSEVPP